MELLKLLIILSFIKGYHMYGEECDLIYPIRVFTLKSAIQCPSSQLGYRCRSNLTLCWRLEAARYDMTVRIKVVEMQLDHSTGCKAGDYFEARDGPSPTSPLLLRWCGTDMPQLTSTADKMFLKFNLANQGVFSLIFWADFRMEKVCQSSIGPVLGGIFGVTVFIFILSLAVSKNNRYRRWRSTHISRVSVMNVGTLVSHSVSSQRPHYPGRARRQPQGNPSVATISSGHMYGPPPPSYSQSCSTQNVTNTRTQTLGPPPQYTQSNACLPGEPTPATGDDRGFSISPPPPYRPRTGTAT